MLRALVHAGVAAAAAVPFGWHHPPSAPLRLPDGVAGIAVDGPTLVVAGKRKLLITPLGPGQPYSRKVCASGFARDGRSAVALSGGRLAWLCRGPAGPNRVLLEPAPLAPPAPPLRVVDRAQGVSHPPTVTTPWLSYLVGGGGQIAYAHGDPAPHPFMLGTG